MFMADQNGDSKGPREAMLPAPPSPGQRRRTETLKGSPILPQPLAAPPAPKSLEKPAAEARPRLSRTQELMATLESLHKKQIQEALAGESPARAEAQHPFPSRFGRDDYEFVQQMRSRLPPEAPKEPMDWGDLKFRPREVGMKFETTLLHMPAVKIPAGTPPAPAVVVSKKFWTDAGIPWREREHAQKEKAKAWEDLPDIKRRLDHWCLSLNHPAKEVLLNALIEDAVSAFSGLKRASKEGQRNLEIVCSGGRPTFLVESAVGVPIGTISDNFIRKFNEMRANGLLPDQEAKALIEQLVRFVFYAQKPAEGKGQSELEMRNGFFRAVTWCICARTNPALFSEFFSRNNISLIDGLGIAVGLNSSDANAVMGEEGLRTALYRLMKKRWVATGFEHLKELLKKDMGRGELDARAVFHFITVLLREVGEYQRIAQSYSIQARNMLNLSTERKKFAGTVMYMSEGRFIRHLMLRNIAPELLWRAIGKMHAFTAKLFAGHGNSDVSQDERSYAIGRSPIEISDIFSTVLEGLDFLTQEPKMRRIALEAVQHYGIGSGEGQPDSFKKIFAICLFTRAGDMRNYPALYKSLHDHSNPIVSDIALDYAAYLLAKEVNFLFSIGEAPLAEARSTLTPEDLRQIFDEGDAPF